MRLGFLNHLRDHVSRQSNEYPELCCTVKMQEFTPIWDNDSKLCFGSVIGVLRITA